MYVQQVPDLWAAQTHKFPNSHVNLHQECRVQLQVYLHVLELIVQQALRRY